MIIYKIPEFRAGRKPGHRERPYVGFFNPTVPGENPSWQPSVGYVSDNYMSEYFGTQEMSLLNETPFSQRQIRPICPLQHF